MTTDESRRLELAYGAWRATQPNDAEVRAGAIRIERALQRQRMRRAGPVLRALLASGAIALLAALAYASAVSRARLSSRPEQRSQQTSGAQPQHRMAPERPSTAGDQPMARPSEVPLAKQVQQKPKLEGRAAPHTTTDNSTTHNTLSWRDVDDALAARDTARAQQILEQLAKDPVTATKARLGLAQLALGRGDCPTARRLAQGLQNEASGDERTARRAHDILTRCDN